ncbi:DNA polymerase III subunit theta, partial [Klebsiella pneumoniae]|uniref:DNA polymerase III subunit theta n=1 Tax=Klebsiella pneumoniae TaxID=573 RepID=UPI0021CBC9F3
MSQWNIASFSKEEQDKVAVDKVAADVAWQERMNKPVMPGNDSNLLIVFYVQIMPDDFVMQL